jgi:hypothetical protein
MTDEELIVAAAATLFDLYQANPNKIRWDEKAKSFEDGEARKYAEAIIAAIRPAIEQRAREEMRERCAAELDDRAKQAGERSNTFSEFYTAGYLQAAAAIRALPIERRESDVEGPAPSHRGGAVMSDGLRYCIEIYLVSEATDAETCVTIRSPVPFPTIPPVTDVRTLMTAILSTDCGHLFEATDDWRLMTGAEIADYREREAR